MIKYLIKIILGLTRVISEMNSLCEFPSKVKFCCIRTWVKSLIVRFEQVKRQFDSNMKLCFQKLKCFQNFSNSFKPCLFFTLGFFIFYFKRINPQLNPSWYCIIKYIWMIQQNFQIFGCIALFSPNC